MSAIVLTTKDGGRFDLTQRQALQCTVIADMIRLLEVDVSSTDNTPLEVPLGSQMTRATLEKVVVSQSGGGLRSSDKLGSCINCSK